MQVCLQVGWALEYLHGEGVIHLDVNPSNVLIRDHGGAAMQQQLDEEYKLGTSSGYGTPKTPGGTQMHTRPFLTAWAMLADLGLSSRARDSHTSIDVFSYKDTSKQPQRTGGTPQFWAPEQILKGYSFWGKLSCPRDCPIQIDAPIMDQVDAWGWATTTIRFFGCTRLLWDFGYSAFVEWLKSEESQERLPSGIGTLLASCLRIQPSARPSCAKISHSMCELLQLQTCQAGYKVDKFQPAIEPRMLVPFVRSQQYVCSLLLDKTDAQCRGSTALLGKMLRVFGPFEEALTVTLDALEMKKMSLADGKTSTTATADAELARYLAAAGTAHSKLGHVVQAAKFYEMALDTYNRSLVPNHPSIAALLNNYGVLYEHKGEYDKAVAMHEQALLMRQQVLGEWHTDVSVSLNNLAILYRRIGNYNQAVPLYEKSLAIRQRSLGNLYTHTHTHSLICVHIRARDRESCYPPALAGNLLLLLLLLLLLFLLHLFLLLLLKL
jgi:tetratricopeptide (TPR) repeat protein